MNGKKSDDALFEALKSAKSARKKQNRGRSCIEK
jgi:hypothetical protein